MIKIIFKNISIIFLKDVVEFFNQTKLNVEIRLTLAEGVVIPFYIVTQNDLR